MTEKLQLIIDSMETFSQEHLRYVQHSDFFKGYLNAISDLKPKLEAFQSELQQKFYSDEKHIDKLGLAIQILSEIVKAKNLGNYIAI